MSCPTGMIDLDPYQTEIRNKIFKIALKCFETRGSVRIDTPVVEMFQTVKNLYGGDFNKQVFTIDENSEQKEENKNADTRMLLRYDLTVPLCRYVNSLNLKQFRRHQIGKVYRKDHAQISKGRFREFYQMDFDIIGNSEENIYDIEMIDTLCDVMDKLLGLNNLIIKINHRCVVDALLDYAKIKQESKLNVCSILDRLDKVQFCDIEDELLLIVGKESLELLNTFNKNKSFDFVKCELNLNLTVLNNLDQIFKFKPFLHFDPFLIRGMDYYTGIVFEVGYVNKEIMPFTISAGGRYDNMIGSFGGNNVPAIGMSLGVERIAKILEQTSMKSWNPIIYDIYVATVCKTVDENITFEQMKICSELRNMGYRVLTPHIKEQKFKRHLDNVLNNNIKYMVILGDQEMQTNSVSIKNICTKEQISVNRTELLKYFKDNFK